MEERFDDVIVGPQALCPRVVSVHPLPEYHLALTFDNGEQRVFDASPLLQYPAFRSLRSETFFRTVRVQYGTICWPGDIDYCPDTLYAQSVETESAARMSGDEALRSSHE